MKLIIIYEMNFFLNFNGIYINDILKNLKFLFLLKEHIINIIFFIKNYLYQNQTAK